MIYWYTGQPGHGKTLHAIDHLLKFRDEGRLCYVGNVRGFLHEKARVLAIEPEQFCNWMEFLPDGAVCLIDEAYEHGMLTKRPAGSRVPDHVRELAKHRHRGIDFIFVSQSPAKQVDEFMHDLIERQIHVRRRFGTPFVHLRIFDRFERNPEKASPLILKRTKLPKRPRGLYESTTMDTVERKIPWYYVAAALLIPALAYGAWWNVNNVHDKLSGGGAFKPVAGPSPKARPEDGAPATAEGRATPKETPEDMRAQYAAKFTAVVPGQPWTAPAYAKLQVPSAPPRVFCIASSTAPGHFDSCHCVTEQATAYALDLDACVAIARNGQYEPFIDAAQSERRRMDDVAQFNRNREAAGGVGGVAPYGVGAGQPEGPPVVVSSPAGVP